MTWDRGLLVTAAVGLGAGVVGVVVGWGISASSVTAPPTPVPDASPAGHGDRVAWYDDFLGTTVNPAYSTSVGGSGRIAMSRDPQINGWVCLETGSQPGSGARLRLGEDSDDGLAHVFNFTNRQQVRLTTRVMVDSPGDFDATIGFVSLNDPDNGGGALLHQPDPGWFLQTVFGGPDLDGTGRLVRPDQATTVPTSWEWSSGVAYVVDIVSSPGEVVARVDGATVARIDSNIPDLPLLVEFQLWNYDYGTSPRLCLDYLSVVQPRYAADVAQSPSP